MHIQKGIREVKWITKEGTHTRYQVRITRKDYKVNKLFDSLNEAREFLSLSNSRDGRKAITEFSERDELLKKWMADYLANPPLKDYLAEYFKKYLDKSGTPTKELSSLAYKSRIKSICGTEIFWLKREVRGLVALNRQGALGRVVIKFGDMKLEDINEQVADDYIRARLEKVKKVTVKSEASMLQAFFNKLRYMDPATFKRLEGNPFEKADKSLFKESAKKRHRRLSEDEEQRLFEALRKCKSKEMIAIVALALATGCRRGELLEIKWENVKERTIEIENGKSGFRVIPKSDLARIVIETIPRKDQKLFHYTSDGFSSNWDRVKKWAKIEDLRFHDMRREFISRCVEQLRSDALTLAEATSLADVNHIQNHYIEPLKQRAAEQKGINSESDLMRAIGHKDRSTTARYFTLKKE